MIAISDTQIGQKLPLAPENAQIAVQMKNGTSEAPVSWISSPRSRRRRSASSVLLSTGRAGRSRRS
jgi:hypothetical protein